MSVYTLQFTLQGKPQTPMETNGRQRAQSDGHELSEQHVKKWKQSLALTTSIYINIPLGKPHLECRLVNFSGEVNHLT